MRHCTHRKYYVYFGDGLAWSLTFLIVATKLINTELG